MPDPIRSILFLCVANSARSQLAEALCRQRFGDRIGVYSAGSCPTSVRPQAIEALAQIGISAAGQYSKLADDFDPQAIDLVVTLCAEEVCPLFLGMAQRLHWPIDDPATDDPSFDNAVLLQRFVRARDAISARLSELTPLLHTAAPRLARLDSIYRLTRYVVHANPRFELRIGRSCEELDRRLAATDSSGATFVTACNPQSEPSSAADNERLHADLLTNLTERGACFFGGEGLSLGGPHREASALVFHTDRQQAEGLRRQFDQTAVVFCGRGGVAELVFAG